MIYFTPIFLASLFLSLNFGALLYIKSSLVEAFFGESGLSVVFFAAALINAALFLLAPRLLKKFSKEKLFLLFMLMISFGTWGLFAAQVPWAVALSLLSYESFIFMAYWALDIFLEEKTNNKETGEIRGIYYTLINFGIAAGSFLVSLLAEGENLNRIYFAAAIFLVLPFSFGIWSSLFKKTAELKMPETESLPFRLWYRRRNIRAVTLVRLVLETFFATMVIYTPLYLHKEIGFAWNELGIIFTVMLLPFILLEWPAGRLADRVMGEKEMMSLGLFIMGLTLVFMPFLGPGFYLWMLVLFLSRVGASLVEIMTESYFFKKISSRDTGLLGIFRLTRPVSIMFGTSLGLVSLSFLSFEEFFLVVSLLVFWGLYESLYLEDTL